MPRDHREGPPVRKTGTRHSTCKEDASASASGFLGNSTLVTWKPPDNVAPAVLALVAPVTAKHCDSRVQPRVSFTSTTHTHHKWRQSPRPSRPDEPSRFNPDGRRFNPGSCAAPVQSRRRFKPGTHTSNVTTPRPSRPDEPSRFNPDGRRFNPGSCAAPVQSRRRFNPAHTAICHDVPSV